MRRPAARETGGADRRVGLDEWAWLSMGGAWVGRSRERARSGEVGRAQRGDGTGERRAEKGVTGRSQGDGMKRGRGLGEFGWFGKRRVGPQEEGPGEERRGDR